MKNCIISAPDIPNLSWTAAEDKTDTKDKRFKEDDVDMFNYYFMFQAYV